MDFWQTVLLLFRRWYVAIPTFVAGLGLAFVAYSLAPASYESGTVLVLTSPLAGGTEVPARRQPTSLTNPLLNFDPSLSQTAALLIQEVKSPAVAAQLGVQPGSDTHYDVNNGSSNPELLQNGPFIFVTGFASTPAAAEDLARRVADRVALMLEQRQEEVLAPASTHIEVQRVVDVTDGQRLTGKPARVAATSLAVAGLASLMAVYAFESFATRKRRRPSSRWPGPGRPPEQRPRPAAQPTTQHSPPQRTRETARR